MRAARLALVAVIATGLYAPDAHAGKFGERMRSFGSKIASLFKRRAPDEGKARAAFERFQQTGKKRDFKIMVKNSPYLKDAYKFHMHNTVVDKVVGIDPQTGQKISEPQIKKTGIGKARFFKALGIAAVIAPVPVVGKAVGIGVIGGAQLKINKIKKNARASTAAVAEEYFAQRDAEALTLKQAMEKATRSQARKRSNGTKTGNSTRIKKNKIADTNIAANP